MNGVRAGFHVGDAVSTATGGREVITGVGANDGGIEGPNRGTLGIGVWVPTLGARVEFTEADGLAVSTLS